MRNLKMLSMLTFMAAMNEGMNHPLSSAHGVKESPKRPIKKIIPKGLKEFHYLNGSTWAINQKNADRKAKKLGWI